MLWDKMKIQKICFKNRMLALESPLITNVSNFTIKK